MDQSELERMIMEINNFPFIMEIIKEKGGDKLFSINLTHLSVFEIVNIMLEDNIYNFGRKLMVCWICNKAIEQNPTDIDSVLKFGTMVLKKFPYPEIEKFFL